MLVPHDTAGYGSSKVLIGERSATDDALDAHRLIFLESLKKAVLDCSLQGDTKADQHKDPESVNDVRFIGLKPFYHGQLAMADFDLHIKKQFDEKRNHGEADDDKHIIAEAKATYWKIDK